MKTGLLGIAADAPAEMFVKLDIPVSVQGLKVAVAYSLNLGISGNNRTRLFISVSDGRAIDIRLKKGVSFGSYQNRNLFNW